MMNFLTARWVNLVLMNYEVPREVLAARLPRGLELDEREGRHFLSLVAFDFLDTRVLGVPWPGHRNFPEINLRYYVRHGNQRGVVFVREYVPRMIVAQMASWIYNEPYVARPMTSVTRRVEGHLEVEHRLKLRSGTQRLSVRAEEKPMMEPVGSWADFFKEHQWGFGTDRRGRLMRYEVNHPVWETYPVVRWELDWDWEAVYGREWAFLSEAKPHSVLMAAGSPVQVRVLGRV
jgi:uncharacterized protein YqjF (DUF2071 family)